MGRLRKAPAVIASLATEKVAGRSNLILLLILLSIVVATPVSAEEIKLTTIIPDQTILRTKKGAIGNTYSNPGTVSDGSIPTSGLLVEDNVGIGTGTTPLTAKLEVSGNMRLAATARPAGTAGMIYYGTDNIMYYHNGSTWVPMGGGSGGGGAFGLWSVLGGGYWGPGNNSSTEVIVVASAETCTALRGLPDQYTLMAKSGGAGAASQTRCITFPVRKGDWWKVTASAGSTNLSLKTLQRGN